MNQPDLARPARTRRIAVLPDRATAVRVRLAWTPGTTHELVPGLAPTTLELVAKREAAPKRTWTCPQSAGRNWVDTIRSSRCGEVVLTAELGDDTSAKHIVLELAELLTLMLRATQPLIRVLFLPTTHDSRRIRSAL